MKTEEMEEKMQEMIAEGKRVDAERAKYKKEEAKKVIAAHSQISEIVKSFQTFVSDNKSKLIGKKLFLTNGGRSKVFDAFFEEFLKETKLTFENVNGLQWLYIEQKSDYTALEISICVNGGYYRENGKTISTNYCTYVRERVTDLIIIDADSKFINVDMTPRLTKVYNYESFEAAKLAIRNLEKEIEFIKDKISDWKREIPSELR